MYLRRLLLLTLLLLGLGIGSASTALASSPLDKPIIHVVASGETLTAIAAHYGTTLDALVAANQLANRDNIYIGSRLTIPTVVTTQAPKTGTVSPLTVIDEINMTGADGASAVNADTGGADTPSSDDASTASSAAGGAVASNYIVKSGDTLSAVANNHSLTVAALAAANDMSSQDFVYVGQVLNIPTGNGTASPASATTEADEFFSTTYIVRAGDTINGIAARFGVTSYSIISANALS
ncbi:MAG: LysM peptidoglycan-binding domain-containing protein, partial [Chloroflexi bacterium]|nr:LysM peptidoglycan-binding domain-containing protein [Chloroflexota bacterium]